MTRRRPGTAIFLLACLLAASAPAAATEEEAETCETVLIEAIRLYGDLDYDHAERLLDASIDRCLACPNLSDRIKVGLLEQAVFVKIARGKERDAERYADLLFAINPDHRPDPSRCGPAIAGIFERGRQQHAAERANVASQPERDAAPIVPAPPIPAAATPASAEEAPATPPAVRDIRAPDEPGTPPISPAAPPSPATPPRFEAGLTLGAALLTGADHRRYGAGLALAAEGRWSFHRYAFLGVGLLAGLHPAVEDREATAFAWLGAEVSIGPQLVFSAPLRLRGGARLGVMGFGLDGVSEAWAVAPGALIALDGSPFPGVWLGLGIGWRQATDRNGRSSSLFDGAVSVSYGW